MLLKILVQQERPHTARYPPCTSKAIAAARGGGLTPPVAERCCAAMGLGVQGGYRAVCGRSYVVAGFKRKFTSGGADHHHPQRTLHTSVLLLLQNVYMPHTHTATPRVCADCTVCTVCVVGANEIFTRVRSVTSSPLHIISRPEDRAPKSFSLVSRVSVW